MNTHRKIRTTISIVTFLAVVLLAFAAGMLVQRFTPSKEEMTPQEYFEVPEGEVLVLYDYERMDVNAVVQNGVAYMPVAFVQEYFNKRFYEDIHNHCLLYTVADDVYTYEVDKKGYTDLEGTFHADEDAVSPWVIEADGEILVSMELVRRYTSGKFVYRIYGEPDRIVICSAGQSDTSGILVTKKTQMRIEPDIKSDIILQLEANDTLQLLEEQSDGWTKVRSDDGLTGYVRSRDLGDTFSFVWEDTSEVDESLLREPEGIHFDTKINLTWHALGAAVGAQKVTDSLSDTKGINVLSPTWYSIIDNDGEVSTYANKEYVDRCHELGIMVWPLIDDFDTGLDGVQLYSDRETRTKLINRLIKDSQTYGFDGINIDFEKVTSDSAVHYLQFIRELSIACHKENLVLSIDNYVPTDYNEFYDRAEQAVWADYIIIMGYDEHWSGSDAGSVASIGFVEDGITGTLKEVPAEKVINAMPFYTRIWVETPNADGSVTTTSKAVGMETAYNTIMDSGYPAIWDETCGQYYCSYDYAEGNSVVKIWLEDARSIEEKMKLFEQYDLAGVASWRLGFEKAEVWDVILKYIQ